MTIQPLAKSYDKAGFSAYLHGEVTDRLLKTLWRPRGVVLHNTDTIGGPNAESVKNFYVDSTHGNKPLAGAQRIKNMWVQYEQKGWAGGPHLVLTDREIFTANPLWLKGTHSPSWNSTFWGLEMVGNYDREPFPPGLRDLTVYTLAALYSLLGHEPSETTFHLHKEDLQSSHRHCPGVNAGPKARWIADVRATMAAMHPGGHEPPNVA